MTSLEVPYLNALVGHSFSQILSLFHFYLLFAPFTDKDMPLSIS